MEHAIPPLGRHWGVLAGDLDLAIENFILGFGAILGVAAFRQRLRGPYPEKSTILSALARAKRRCHMLHSQQYQRWV
jgi:hypothetical protein